MFHFFQTIFSGVTSLMASAIIAVGLVSMPSPAPIVQPLQQPQRFQNEEILTIQEPEIQKPEKQKPEIVVAPVKPVSPKASETMPTPTSAPTSVPASAPTSIPASTPVSTPTPTLQTEGQSVTLTDVLGRSRTFEDPIINKQEILSLLGIGFVVTKGNLPETIFPKSTPAPTSIPTSVPTKEALEITSVNVTPEVNSARIEWQTNKPTTAKVFLSGGNMGSTVFHSESSLSTRHFTNITGLTSNTSYSYEIESVAGEQVAKKDGSFSTKTGELTIQADKTSLPLTDWFNLKITAQYTEKGKAVPVDNVSFSIPDGSKINYRAIASNSVLSSNGTNPCGNLPLLIQKEPYGNGGTCSSDGTIFFYLERIKTSGFPLGVSTISVAANGVNNSIDIQITPYVEINPTVKVFSLSSPSEILENGGKIPQNYTGAVIGRFALVRATGLDEGVILSKIIAESDIKDGLELYDFSISSSPIATFIGESFALFGVNRPNFDTGSLNQVSPRSLIIKLANSKNYVGVHYLTIKEIEAFGAASGNKREVLGLPVTFTYTVQ